MLWVTGCVFQICVIIMDISQHSVLMLYLVFLCIFAASFLIVLTHIYRNNCSGVKIKHEQNNPVQAHVHKLSLSWKLTIFGRYANRKQWWTTRCAPSPTSQTLGTSWSWWRGGGCLERPHRTVSKPHLEHLKPRSSTRWSATSSSLRMYVLLTHSQQAGVFLCVHVPEMSHESLDEFKWSLKKGIIRKHLIQFQVGCHRQLSFKNIKMSTPQSVSQILTWSLLRLVLSMNLSLHRWYKIFLQNVSINDSESVC